MFFFHCRPSSLIWATLTSASGSCHWKKHSKSFSRIIRLESSLWDRKLLHFAVTAIHTCFSTPIRATQMASQPNSSLDKRAFRNAAMCKLWNKLCFELQMVHRTLRLTCRSWMSGESLCQPIWKSCRQQRPRMRQQMKIRTSKLSVELFLEWALVCGKFDPRLTKMALVSNYKKI